MYLSRFVYLCVAGLRQRPGSTDAPKSGKFYIILHPSKRALIAFYFIPLHINVKYYYNNFRNNVYYLSVERAKARAVYIAPMNRVLHRACLIHRAIKNTGRQFDFTNSTQSVKFDSEVRPAESAG